MNKPIIIIGAGLAGYTLAKDIRKEHSDYPITIITACQGRYYSKPQLSTALALNKTVDHLVMSSAELMAEHHQLTVIPNAKVTAINADEKTVEVNGESHSYHKLVLALGADLIAPPLTGDAVADVLAVNHIEQYDQFVQRLSKNCKVAIMGAGLVGCEFANDLIKSGHQVTMIAPCCAPLPQLLPEPLGVILQQQLATNGVSWHLQDHVSAINHHNKGYQLELASGDVVQADVVLSAIGLTPKCELAKQAGIETGRGIIVDSFCKTNIDDIYAIGDCMEMSQRLRQYVAPILHCARALAKTVLGQATSVSYPIMPIVVKTSLCPVVVVNDQADLSWEVDDCRALGRDHSGVLRGVALVGDACKERAQWLKELNALAAC